MPVNSAFPSFKVITRTQPSDNVSLSSPIKQTRPHIVIGKIRIFSAGRSVHENISNTRVGLKGQIVGHAQVRIADDKGSDHGDLACV
jgi:hypothetical protein